MGRTKAKKKIHPMPKLGFCDQCIYALGYLLILAVLAVLFWFRFYFIEEQAMEEPGAVACEAHGSICGMDKAGAVKKRIVIPKTYTQ